MRAETAADFYRGKTIRILVGSPPGGGYDIYARLVTPALAAKLGATVLVENKDGNGGLAALATLLVRPADGLTIMNGSAEAAIISQMLGRPGAIWDVTKLNWLAKMASAPKLWFVGKDARYQSIAAAKQADPLTWSATGPADDISDVQATISYVLGLKSKIVTGYRGSGDMSLAVIRNEVDSGLLSADSALQHIGEIKPLAVFGPKRWPHLPDVPTLTEAVSKRALVKIVMPRRLSERSSSAAAFSTLFCRAVSAAASRLVTASAMASRHSSCCSRNSCGSAVSVSASASMPRNSSR